MENFNKKRNWNEIYLKNMKYQSFKRRNYCISSLDDGKEKLYIIGYDYNKKEGFMPNTNLIINKVQKQNKSIDEIFMKDYLSDSENLINKGWSVLDSLISLRQELDFSYNIDEDCINNKQLIELEKSISNKDKKKIIKWTEKYGMPFLGDRDKTIILNVNVGTIPFNYGFTNDIKTCIEKDSCICRLGTFLISINIIYKTLFFYLLYLYKKDIDSIPLYIFKNNNNITDNDIDEFLKEYSMNDLESYIKRAFLSIKDKAVINSTTLFDENKTFKFESYAETLISLAMYQLATITSFKKIYDVSRCKLCNNLFIPTRKTRKYCMKCSRQKKYQQKPK